MRFQALLAIFAIVAFFGFSLPAASQPASLVGLLQGLQAADASIVAPLLKRLTSTQMQSLMSADSARKHDLLCALTAGLQERLLSCSGTTPVELSLAGLELAFASHT